MAGAKKTSAKKAVGQLAQAGPHEVLRGDLALVGLPGTVFTPASGSRRPAVAFAHDWLQPAWRYDGLLRHLASWGIVAVAPDTETGPLASHRRLAHDLRTALTVCSRVRLGGSARGAAVSVDPRRLGVAGHGMGGSTAALAAAAPGASTTVGAAHETYTETGSDLDIRAVATLALTETHPSAVDTAHALRVPAMHVAFGTDRVAPSASGARPVAEAWAGPSSLRTLKKATHQGVVEGHHWSDLVIDGKPDSATRSTVRALLTGFFLYRLAGDATYADVEEGAVKNTEVETFPETAAARTLSRRPGAAVRA